MDIYGKCRLSKDVDANDTNMSHQKYRNITVSFAFDKPFALIKVYPLRITTLFGSRWLILILGFITTNRLVFLVPFNIRQEKREVV